MTTPEVIAVLRRERPELSELRRLRIALAAVRVIRRVPVNHAADALRICLGVSA